MNHTLLVNLIKLARVGVTTMGANQPSAEMVKLWAVVAEAEAEANRISAANGVQQATTPPQA